MIVKNCPAFTGENACVSSKTNTVECSKNKDCIIKKIIKENSEVSSLFEIKLS